VCAVSSISYNNHGFAVFLPTRKKAQLFMDFGQLVRINVQPFSVEGRFGASFIIMEQPGLI
jgi:hypothetical protein